MSLDAENFKARMENIQLRIELAVIKERNRNLERQLDTMTEVAFFGWVLFCGILIGIVVSCCLHPEIMKFLFRL